MSEKLIEVLELCRNNLAILESRLADNQEKRKEAEIAQKVAYDNMQQLIGAIHGYKDIQAKLDSVTQEVPVISEPIEAA